MNNLMIYFILILLIIIRPETILAQNLILNPDFETGDLTGWNQWGNGITSNIDEVYQGGFSGFLKEGIKGSLQQDVNLKSNTAYRASVLAKVANQGEKVVLIINDGSNKTVDITSAVFKQYSIEFTTGTISEPVMISFYKHEASYGKAFCDNFELIETGDEVNDIHLSLNAKRVVVDRIYEIEASVIPSTAADNEITLAVENITGEATVDASNRFFPTKEGLVNLTATYNSNAAISKTISVYITKASETFFVDANEGDDNNRGTSIQKAWKTLKKVNDYDFLPGDSILFKSGSVWTGQLEINNSGTADSFIVFSNYGSGKKPLINGDGGEKYTIYLLNSAYTRVSNFEVTNTGDSEIGGRYGVIMEASNAGDIHNTEVLNLDIHDVNGHKEKKKGGGGGILWKIGGDTKSRFVDPLIQGLHIYDCTRNGMNGKSDYGTEYYSVGMRIRENLIERIPGDGIVILGCDSAIVEYNICRDFTDDLPIAESNAAAGIWPFSSRNTIIQYNEVSDHKAYWDGQGFDSDWNCENTTIQYNYSHDNGGGFILICSNGSYVPEGEKSNNYNTIVRYNISINDGYRNWGTNGKYFCPTFHLAGPIYNTRIYNNTIYMAPKPDSNIERTFVEATNWGGPWPEDTYFYNNIFYATEATDFIMGESKNYEFSHNLFFGSVSRPQDSNAVLSDPKFINAGESSNSDNYRLQSGSPAINAGKLIEDNGGFDFFGNEVSKTERSNIGADNGTGETKINTQKEQGNYLKVYPNLTDDMINININTEERNVLVKLLTLTGKVLKTEHYQTGVDGVLTYDVSNLKQGAYCIVVETNNMKQVRRFIKK